MALPPIRHATPSTAGLSTLDYRTHSVTSTPAVGGLCSVTFEPVPAGKFWLIDRMVVSCTSTAQTVARVYTDQPSPDRLENATPAGNLDVDDSNSPLLVDSTAALLVTWSGADDGATATARIQYRLMART